MNNIDCHLYRNNLKNRQIDQGGSSDFLAGTSGIARGKTRSEDEKYEAAETQKMSGGHFLSGADERSELARREPTQVRSDSSSCFGIERPSALPFLACVGSSVGNVVVSVLVIAGAIGIASIPIVGQALVIAALAVWFLANLGATVAVCRAEKLREFPEVQIEGKREFPGEVEMVSLRKEAEPSQKEGDNEVVKCPVPLTACFSDEGQGEVAMIRFPYVIRFPQRLTFPQLHSFAKPK